MSWDVLFAAFPPGLRSLDELEDEPLAPLGSRAEVMRAITAAVPMADFHDPAWGRLATDEFSIELNVGDDDPVQSIMLHVRGGDGALGAIRALAEALGRPALDCSEGALIDFSSPSAAAGFQAWRAYRDRVVGPDR